MDRLRELPIAYEVPTTATVGKAFDVTLSIDGTPEGTPAAALPQRETVIEDAVALSEDVEANLTASAGFEVRHSNVVRQKVGARNRAVWRWSVTPLGTSGEQENLYLTIYAFAGEDEGSEVLASYSSPIDIEVVEARGGFSSDDLLKWVSIIGGIITILLGIIALWPHRKGTSSASSET